jgi:hypothetical protein
LYAIVGTFWVVSLVGILFLASYFYQTIKEDPLQATVDEYFWDAPRVIVVFCLALATFYAGVSRRVADLPALIAYQMTVQPVPMWTSDIWLMMSLLCLVLAMTSTLISITWSPTPANDWRVVDAAPAERSVSSTRRLPQPAQQPPVQQPPVQQQREYTPIQFPRVVRSRNWQRMRRSLVTVGLVALFVLAGWQILTRVGTLGALGRGVADFTMSAMLPERATPTPTPDGEMEALSAPDATPVAPSPGAEQAASGAAGAGVPDAAPENQSRALAVTTALPQAATPAPTPTVTPTRGVAEQPHVLIENQYGVNARSQPSLDGTVQTVLSPQTRVPILERSADQEWIRVQLEDGSQAWVAASVVTVVEPPAAPAVPPTEPPPSNPPTAPPTAPAAIVAADDAQPTPAPVAQSAPQPTATAQQAEAPVVAAAQSYTISLLNPEDGSAVRDSVTLRWSSGFTPAVNQAFEPVIWRVNESPLRDGVSLGVPMRGGPGEVMQIDAELVPRLGSGEYRWGVLLVQQDPYQRLALLSGERALIVP